MSQRKGGVKLNTAIEVKPWTDLVWDCASQLDKAYESEMQKIETNLAIGEIVSHIIAGAEYGDNAVEKFASDLTKKRKRTVYPQRLYEAYRVYDSVKTISKVREIAGNNSEEVSWNWLVKHATKGFDKERHPEVRREIFDSTLKRVEATVGQLEKLITRNAPHLTEEDKEQVRGVAVGVIQTLQNACVPNNENDTTEEQGVPQEGDSVVLSAGQNDAENTILSYFERTDASLGIFQHKGAWWAPKFGCDTLSMVIDALRGGGIAI